MSVVAARTPTAPRLDTCASRDHNSLVGAKWLQGRVGLEPWQPTAAQNAAAERLAAAESGYVRTFADGTAELRTHRRCGLLRYVIRADGEVALVESGPPRPRRYAWGQRAGWLAVGLMLGAFVLAVALTRYRTADRYGASFGWMFLVGLGAWVAGRGLCSCPQARPPAGERWERIGLPED
jgi:hypothetical protein